ncbi:MAG: DMT family transporter [Actinomycetota bacterium]|nr:DMT family transporter [Actinomycetota bacterium]MDA2974193.1 DMT family transporter [Actinomycetota bacterium]MDA3009806.1 DMT family transporter [Actinomycetota bacterium]
MTEHHPRRRLGWLLAALGMLFVSTDAFFVRLSEVDAWTIGFLMACGSVVSLGAVAFARRDSVPAGTPLVSPMMLVIGGLNALTQMLFITAVTRSEVANVVVIVAAAPLFAALIAWVALRERTEPRVAAAIALTTVGIGSVMAGSLGTPTLDGDLIAVLAILAFAATIVIWRRHPGLDRPRTLVVGSAIMAAAASLFADWSAIDARALLAGAGMGLIFNPTGRMLYSSAPRFAPASEVAVFAPVETVAATVWVWVAFGEQPTATTVLGGVIVISSVLLATVRR